jgi:hypothetical protein
MEAGDLLGIPFATDCKVGNSYGDMVKLGKDLLAETSRVNVSYDELVEFEKNKHPEEKEVEDIVDEDDEDDEGED